jgi:hypothetical protein
MVDKWKYFVLRSVHVSQLSLDFDFQRISSLRRRSSRDNLRLASSKKEEELGERFVFG